MWKYAEMRRIWYKAASLSNITALFILSFCAHSQLRVAQLRATQLRVEVVSLPPIGTINLHRVNPTCYIVPYGCRWQDGSTNYEAGCWSSIPFEE